VGNIFARRRSCVAHIAHRRLAVVRRRPVGGVRGGTPRHHAPRHHAPRTREPGLVAFSRGLWRPGAIRVNTTWAILIARTIQIDMSCSHKLSFPAWHHCCSLHYAQSGGSLLGGVPRGERDLKQAKILPAWKTHVKKKLSSQKLVLSNYVIDHVIIAKIMVVRKRIRLKMAIILERFCGQRFVDSQS
jgi:hypothetical protein